MTSTSTPGTEAEASASPAPLPLGEPSRVPESFSYRLKNVVLGPPLTTEQLQEQKLGNFAALGVLAPDMISSTAYGSEEMLRILVPAVGLAAFSLVIPVTAAILGILFFVTLSYREVVMAYTKTGGSYMVSRENFGPRIAQVAAAALIIDYCLTVAVQVAAGTAYIDSAVPVLAKDHGAVIMSVAVVLLMMLANLRGVREASRIFVVPTYVFVFSMVLLVLTGLVRAALGDLHAHSIALKGAVHGPAHVAHGGLLMGATVFVLLKSLANGGSSLTGLEAISNGVSAFRPPAGRNARRTLVMMSTTLGTLVLGVSILAHITHAVPYVSGYPTVVAQEADYIFGTHGLAHAGYYLIIVATVAILWTGGNTSFSGFPFLTSFVAHDAFLPNWLTKRGHRLVFSNGIILLAVVGCLLIIGSNAQLDALVSLYAIGVFTGFTMAGAGMVRYHRRNRERGWKYKQWINGFASVLSAIVVVVFAITKFTSGAWLVVVLLPILVYSFIRINRRYGREAEMVRVGAGRAAAGPRLDRHVVVLLVDELDLATVHALRYARSLVPDTLRVVHYRIDPTRARALEDAWRDAGLQVPLEIMDVPDRRLARATLDLVQPYLGGDSYVSVLLPRRDFGGFAARLLHDRTADNIALALSEAPNVNATIVPYHLSDAAVERRLDRVAARKAAEAEKRAKGDTDKRAKGHKPATVEVPGRTPIDHLEYRHRARVAGIVRSVEIQPRNGIQVLTCRLEDDTGAINLVFSRGKVEGVEPSARISAEGMVGEYDGSLAIRNPTLEVLAPATEEV